MTQPHENINHRMRWNVLQKQTYSDGATQVKMVWACLKKG